MGQRIGSTGEYSLHCGGFIWAETLSDTSLLFTQQSRQLASRSQSYERRWGMVLEAALDLRSDGNLVGFAGIISYLRRRRSVGMAEENAESRPRIRQFQRKT